MYREILFKELQERQTDFTEFASQQSDDAALFAKELAKLAENADVPEALEAADSPGCIPSSEFWKGTGLNLEFKQDWQNHQQSRIWAAETLTGQTTFAADGSQIYLQKETTLPVGAVQIGWFENPHDPAVPYKKEVALELLTPKDLLENQEEPLNPETRIGERRFRLEVGKVKEFIESKRGWTGDKPPIAFFDGTLLVSFSLPQTSLQQSYLEELSQLVQLSEECRVPVIGYIARSFAKDLVSLVKFFNSELPETALYDTGIFDSKVGGDVRVIDSWGSRTPYFYSKRKGLESFLNADSGEARVGFTYLRTGRDEIARLDIPTWVYKEGILEQVADTVRAECIVGLGYPYPLETADAVAVISSKDRDSFLDILREFADREGLGFSVSRKEASKARRR